MDNTLRAKIGRWLCRRGFHKWGKPYATASKAWGFSCGHHWPPAFDLVNADFGIIEHHVMHYTRGYSKQALQDAVLFGRGVDMITIDEYHHNPYLDYIKPDVLQPKEKDWGNKRNFVSGPETPPSKSKRAKLRAKRKKRTK